MPDRFTYQGEPGQATSSLCAMLDATQLGQVATLNPGVTRVGNLIETTGMRRYRVKCIQLTGVGPSRIRALDLPFSPNSANAWVLQVLAAAQATGTRNAYDFGEGGVLSVGGALTLTNFMGPYLAIELQNNGADAATYELELWMQ
jgi:hypothetical protein